MAKSGISEPTNLAFPGVQSVPKKMGGQKKKRQALKKLQHMRVETVKKSSKEPTHDLRDLWYMFVFNEA